MSATNNYTPSPAAVIGNYPISPGVTMQWAVDCRRYMDPSVGQMLYEFGVYYVDPYGDWQFGRQLVALYSLTPTQFIPPGGGATQNWTFAQAVASFGSPAAMLRAFIPDAEGVVAGIATANTPLYAAEAQAFALLSGGTNGLAEAIYNYHSTDGMTLVLKPAPLPYPAAT